MSPKDIASARSVCLKVTLRRPRILVERSPPARETVWELRRSGRTISPSAAAYMQAQYLVTSRAENAVEAPRLPARGGATFASVSSTTHAKYLLSLVVSVPAVAVTVMPDKDDVRISTDQGFQKIKSPTEVDTFTRVLIAPGERAIIYYGESCKVDVRSFATVQKEPPWVFDKPSHFGYEQTSSSLPSDTDYNFHAENQAVGRRKATTVHLITTRC